MKFSKLAVLHFGGAGLLMALVLVGCATRRTVEDEGVRNSFVSNLSPSQLARCMVRSVDGRALGSLKGYQEGEGGSYEVIVRNGDTVWSIAKIKAFESGSKADVYYGGAGKMDIQSSLKWMTEGCS